MFQLHLQFLALHPHYLRSLVFYGLSLEVELLRYSQSIVAAEVGTGSERVTNSGSKAKRALQDYHKRIHFSCRTQILSG